MNNDGLAAGVRNCGYKVAHKCVTVQIIDANTRLDRDWNGPGILHRLYAIGHGTRPVHQAGAK